jgi:hypothetical protein
VKPIDTQKDTHLARMGRMAISIHNAACRMPVVMKDIGGDCVIAEGGHSYLSHCEGEALDRVFYGEGVGHIRIEGGKYSGMTMFASAIHDSDGNRVAAIGLIDSMGMLSIGEFISNDDNIKRQLE